MNHQKNKGIYLLPVLWLLTTCSISSGNQKEARKIDAYFDLAGLMQQQVAYLSETNPKINKNAIIDGQQEALEQDSVNWEKELNIFAKADINKPRLLSQYRTNTYTDDAGHRVTQYQNVDKHVSGVIKMEIVEDPSSNKLLNIFIESGEYNTLFTSEVELEMRFEEKKNEPRLTSYSISGFEKVILRDTMRYLVRVKIG